MAFRLVNGEEVGEVKIEVGPVPTPAPHVLT
jgi:hypothetical protein